MTNNEMHHIPESGANQSEGLTNQFAIEMCNIIHNKLGIVIKADNQELINRILKMTKERIDAFDVYLEKLKKSEPNSEMMRKLIAIITIGETYFYRDKKQIDALRSVIIPNILKRKREKNIKNLRVWSAGCSSGEELYTLIILFSEAISDLAMWNFQFLATDINAELLNKAIAGRYSPWSMRSIPQESLAKYFTFDGKVYSINKDIKEKATFEYLNLNSSLYPSLLNGTSDQDLILCRNVLIYFDLNHIEPIMKRLSHCLALEGYLMLGASDPCLIEGTMLSNSGLLPSLLIKQDKNKNEVKDTKKLIKQYATVSKPEKKEKRDIDTKMELNTVLTQIDSLEHQSKWKEIIEVVNTASLQIENCPKLYTAKAASLANLGKTKEALDQCEKCLAMDPLNVDAYFIRALILSETQSFLEAEQSFKKALFIQPGFLMCKYQLGLLLLRHNQFEKGVRLLNQTLESAKLERLDDIVPHSVDMKYSDLINLLENEIKIHKTKSHEENL